MTDQIHDDRAAAYVQARELLTAAGDIRNAYFVAAAEGRANGHPDELPDAYWALVTEAEILSRLASCDAPVGYLAGAHMVQRKNRSTHLGALRDAGRAAKERRERSGDGRGLPSRDVMAIPYNQGDYVTILDGEHGHRRGRIVETQLERGEVPTATIELDPPGHPLNPSEPIVVTGVSFNSIELVN